MPAQCAFQIEPRAPFPPGARDSVGLAFIFEARLARSVGQISSEMGVTDYTESGLMHIPPYLK